MQLRELILLLLLVLVVAAVIAVVVRRGGSKREGGPHSQTEHVGSQAEWLDAGDRAEPLRAAQAPAAVALGASAAAESAADVEPAVPSEPSAEADTAVDTLDDAETAADAVALEDGGAAPAVADDVAMTRAERREAREAAEAAGIWPVPAPQSDPEAERIATAAEYRDEVVTADPLTEDIAIPANEWGGPHEAEPVVEPRARAGACGRAGARAGACGRAGARARAGACGRAGAGARAGADPETTGRRISGFLELRDGGFGVGSAAPIEDGAQPLDHPVQAYRDTMTFREPGVPGYDSADPDVWFYDASAAERSGFRPADG
jgi:hypothetical protein